MKELMKIIKGLIFDQNNFFKKIAQEKNFKDAFFIFLIFHAVICLALVIFLGSQPSLGYNFPLIIIPIAFIFDVLFIFLFILIIHWFYRLLKGQGHFKDTFNLVVYSMIPPMILAVFAYVIMAFGTFFVTRAPIFAVLLLLFTIPLYLAQMVVFVFFIIDMIIGGSILHKISYWRSFMAGIGLPLLISGGLSLIALIIVMIISLSMGGI